MLHDHHNVLIKTQTSVTMVMAEYCSYHCRGFATSVLAQRTKALCYDCINISSKRFTQSVISTAIMCQAYQQVF